MPKVARLAATPQCADFILEAARQLLAKVGYGAMSMRQLAACAGLLPGSLYHHVAGKQEVLLFVLTDMLETRDAAWRRHSRRAGTLGELRSFIGFLLKRQASHPDEVKILAHEYRHLDLHLQRWLEQRTHSLQSHLHRLVQRGRLEGVFGDIDTASAPNAILALIGSAMGIHDSPEPWSPSRLETHYYQMASRLLDVRPDRKPSSKTRVTE